MMHRLATIHTSQLDDSEKRACFRFTGFCNETNERRPGTGEGHRV